MKFDFDNKRPIYVQLVEKLKLAIVSGIYKPGSKLESIRDLAIQAKVNPNTIQKALIELENNNLIYTERTNGKYVTNDIKLLEKHKNELAKEIVNTYISDMKSIGLTFEDSINYLEKLGGKK